MAKDGPVLLVRVETSPEDIAGMHSAARILTTRGGLTSHAAVVARGQRRPCFSGAGCAPGGRARREGRAWRGRCRPTPRRLAGRKAAGGGRGAARGRRLVVD